MSRPPRPLLEPSYQRETIDRAERCIAYDQVRRAGLDLREGFAPVRGGDDAVARGPEADFKHACTARIRIDDKHGNEFDLRVERIATSTIKGVTLDGAKVSARRFAIKALRASLEALEAEEAAASTTGPTGGTES